MNKGRPPLINPIAAKIRELIKRGVTMEKLCVSADLKFNTLKNIFTRKKVSYATIKGLKYANIIDDQDIREYNEWIQANPEIKKESDASKFKKRYGITRKDAKREILSATGTIGTDTTSPQK